MIVVLTEKVGENMIARQHRAQHAKIEPLIALGQRAVGREGHEHALHGQDERHENEGCGQDGDGARRVRRPDPLPRPHEHRQARVEARTGLGHETSTVLHRGLCITNFLSSVIRK